jgi:RNA polymerase sigma factor (sigma-70 family)
MNRIPFSMHLYGECIRKKNRREAVTSTDTQTNKLETEFGGARNAVPDDAAAFSRLVEENAGMLYRVCRAILRGEADCADAVQEAVIDAWRNIGQLRSAASFPAWAARICIHRCYRIARRRRPPASAAEPAARDSRDARLDVMRAVDGLPEHLRLPVVFHYFEDWSVEETARAMGIFPGTVKSRLHKARRLLAAKLENYKEGYRNDARR